MNPLIYIALVIPFVGILSRHLFITRGRFNEALTSDNPTPTCRSFFVCGALFIIFGVLIGLFLVKSLDHIPVALVAFLMAAEGVWDLWHAMRLKQLIQSRDKGVDTKTEQAQSGSRE